MLIHLIPKFSQFPNKGGVREHLLQFYYHMSRLANMTDDPKVAYLLHVESAWPIPDISKPSVYICHGGFVPPLQVVYDNLEKATKIVSVAYWLLDQYFPQHKDKTVVIPNGINLNEFKKQDSQGYFLYGKEYLWNFDEFYHLTLNRPDLQFVSTVWPDQKPPSNVKVIGLQTREQIKEWIAGAEALVMTGSEVCPTMLLEAWACGVPVIGKNCDGNKELIEKHGGGVLYDELSQVDFNLNRKKLGKEGFMAVNEFYQWKNLVKKYLEVYEDVLK